MSKQEHVKHREDNAFRVQEIRALAARVTALESIHTQDETIHTFKVGDRVTNRSGTVHGVVKSVVPEVADTIAFAVLDDATKEVEYFYANELRPATSTPVHEALGKAESEWKHEKARADELQRKLDEAGENALATSRDAFQQRARAEAAEKNAKNATENLAIADQELDEYRAIRDRLVAKLKEVREVFNSWNLGGPFNSFDSMDLVGKVLDGNQ